MRSTWKGGAPKALHQLFELRDNVIKAATTLSETMSAPSLVPTFIWLGVTVILVIVNAFGVAAAFGSLSALAFWGALVGANMLGWSAWRRFSPSARESADRRVLSAIILNVLLAIEVPLLYRLMGRTDATLDWKPFAYGLLATGFVMFLLRAARARHTAIKHGSDAIVPASTPLSMTPTIVPNVLARAGIVATDLLSVRAEDHYCRLAVRGGTSLLLHYRFRDAVSDLVEVPGAQVHRGAWVADQAVKGWDRIGRRWSLNLVDGSRVPVSETSVGLCRARGWLDRGGPA